MASNKKTLKPVKSNENSTVVYLYLIGYNVVQVIGWSYLLYQFLKYMLIEKYDSKALWETVKWGVIIFQNGALLEVINAALGLVKSNALITLVQVLSRVQLVFLLNYVPTSQSPIGLPLALAAWSITEIIRYSFYACNLIKIVPSFLTWLRYSTFLILYPLGITGELLCIYASQKHVSNTGMFSMELPNAYNFTFSFSYFLCFVMFTYIPIFPQLYGHMLSQRKKILGVTKLKSN